MLEFEQDITKEQQKENRIIEATRDILYAIGENPDKEGLLDTPKRVARMYNEIFSGYAIDPKEYLNRQFESATSQQMIVVRDIPFYSTCMHHIIPFFGTAFIGYIPEKRIVTGLSKLARVVDGYSKRLQIQEDLTFQIATAINEVLQPKGVIVVLKAEHLCMSMRGVEKPGSKTVTSFVTGVFYTDITAKEEFYENLKL